MNLQSLYTNFDFCKQYTLKVDKFYWHCIQAGTKKAAPQFPNHANALLLYWLRLENVWSITSNYFFDCIGTIGKAGNSAL